MFLHVFLDSLNNSYINLKWKNGLMIEQMHLDQFIVKKVTKSNSYVSQYPAGKPLKIVEHMLT